MLHSFDLKVMIYQWLLSSLGGTLSLSLSLQRFWQCAADRQAHVLLARVCELQPLQAQRLFSQHSAHQP